MAGREWERFLPEAWAEEKLHSKFASAFAGRRVLVTGAGGYIGSAVAKLFAVAGLNALVLLDSSERNLFEIQRQVAGEAVLGSVSDAALLEDLFGRFQPQVVFHAAAFKHVALLERNPFAAIANNTLGTYIVAQAARRYRASKLVLISTDKAVRPHSVMGASKRLAELIVVSLSGQHCGMNVVRLGNVIGSSGSVVPIFLEQIARGGPVTVTHLEASRYFLSLNEAVDAILSCAASDWDGTISTPPMREPVRIVQLARYLIDAYRKDSRTIPIVSTGLRAGEKLSEDLETETSKLAPADLEALIERLSACVANRDLIELVQTLSATVPEYAPSELLLEPIAS